MAYSEENSLKTTLLEGSVRFINNGNTNLLIPGQQSRLNKDGSVSIENGIDMYDVLAWKNGLFHFESADIKTVMRQLARWYDVRCRFMKTRNHQIIFSMQKFLVIQTFPMH
jgi:ferric-dicitrate binding protein FerR (iron transport regulator)